MRSVEPDRGPVTAESVIAGVLLARPDAERLLFEEFQLPCYRCEISFLETVEQGARLHQLDTAGLVARLNLCPVWPEENLPPPPAEAP